MLPKGHARGSVSRRDQHDHMLAFQEEYIMQRHVLFGWGVLAVIAPIVILAATPPTVPCNEQIPAEQELCGEADGDNEVSLCRQKFYESTGYPDTICSGVVVTQEMQTDGCQPKGSGTKDQRCIKSGDPLVCTRSWRCGWEEIGGYWDCTAEPALNDDGTQVCSYTKAGALVACIREN